MTKIPSKASVLPSGPMPQRQQGLVQLNLDIPLGEIREESLCALGEVAKRYGGSALYFTKNQVTAPVGG